MIKVCIVHYNTPKLTECLIKSINKYTPNSHIYIFDNSDKYPFVYKQDNITLFDNTKGQIINFDEWLKKYPDRNISTGNVNNFGSAKHSYSIQKCIELINDNFILLDSDILLKKDITPIYDSNYLYVSDTETFARHNTKRCTPFLCFINVNLMKKEKLTYFNDDYMYGLHKTEMSDHYDTGGYLYILGEKYPHKKIYNKDFIVHYRAASWIEDAKSKHNYRPKNTIDGFLNIHKELWRDNEKKNNKQVIYTCITGGYDILNEHQAVNPNFDYVCFTDNPNLKSKTWKIRTMPKETDGLSDVKKQRYVKINAHKVLPEYNLSIWIDGSVEVLKNLDSFINDTCDNEHNIYIPQHPNRRCIYDEFTACSRLKKDNIETMKIQIDRYKKEGFPSKFGLVQSNIMIRRHNQTDCIKLMECWWNELKNNSHRDQLSFNYALWKNNDAKFKEINKRTCESIYFKWNKLHKKGQISNQTSASVLPKVNTNKVIYSSAKKTKPLKLRTFLGSL